MNIGHFVQTEIGPCLWLHSAGIKTHVKFCIAAPAGLSMTDLLTKSLKLKRGLIIEIHGLNNDEHDMIVNDPLLLSADHLPNDKCLQFTIPNNLLEAIHTRVCEILHNVS